MAWAATYETPGCWIVTGARNWLTHLYLVRDAMLWCSEDQATVFCTSAIVNVHFETTSSVT